MMLCSVSVFAKEDTKVLIDEFPNYEGVVYYEGKNQRELQGVLREWIAVNFKSAQGVVQPDDVETGVIIAKGVHSYNTQSGGIVIPNHLDFSLSLKFKDGRFKYELVILEVKTGTQDMTLMNDILLKEIPIKPNGKPYKGFTLKAVNKTKQKTFTEIEEFKTDLLSRLESIVVVDNEDDW